MAYDNTNRGSIWKNEKKQKDTDPDFTGTQNVDGVEYYVSAWRRKEGAPEKAPALSWSTKPKNQIGAAPKRQTGGVSDRAMDDEIPF